MGKRLRNSPDNTISDSDQSNYPSDQENIPPKRLRRESSPTPSLMSDGGTVSDSASEHENASSPPPHIASSQTTLSEPDTDFGPGNAEMARRAAAAQTFTIHEDALPERQEVRITSVQVPIHQKVGNLQDRIFRAVVPEEGFTVNGTNSIPDQSGASASITDRVQTAVEILHVRPEKYGEELARKILEMPRGVERMEAIEKLSPVFDKLPQLAQYRLASTAKYCLYKNDSSSLHEMFFAHKFLTIVRDHLSERDQREHEDFSQFHLTEKSRLAVMHRLADDFAKTINERSDIDDRLSQKTRSPEENEAKILTMANAAEIIVSRFEKNLNLTKDQNLELRQSAYTLRRVTEQLANQNVRDDLPNDKNRSIHAISGEAPERSFEEIKRQKTLDPQNSRAFADRENERLRGVLER